MEKHSSVTKRHHEVRPGSAWAWILAARPKTLAGAAVPVIMALALAYADLPEGLFQWKPALLCLLFAFLMQIDANFVNDLYDFKKGTDDEHRLGPRRACAQGWVTPKQMFGAICLTSAVACFVGLPLIAYGGWQMVVVGALCLLFCFLYTTHLSYWGLGDLLVLVFFGLVPVGITYYLQCRMVSPYVLCAAVTCGMIIDTLLVVNNYRDRDNDRRAGKRTLVVHLGAKGAEYLYIFLGLFACLPCLLALCHGRYVSAFLPLLYLLLHLGTARKMQRIHQGKALNAILGETARNIFAYGLLFAAGVLADDILLFW